MKKLLLQKGGFCAKASPLYDEEPKPLILEEACPKSDVPVVAELGVSWGLLSRVGAAGGGTRRQAGSWAVWGKTTGFGGGCVKLCLCT